MAARPPTLGGASSGRGAVCRPRGNLYEFASILKTVEGLYGLSAMSARDKNAHVRALFSDTALFDFTQSPRTFKPLADAGYQCNSTNMQAPDTDF